MPASAASGLASDYLAALTDNGSFTEGFRESDDGLQGDQKGRPGAVIVAQPNSDHYLLRGLLCRRRLGNLVTRPARHKQSHSLAG